MSMSDIVGEILAGVDQRSIEEKRYTELHASLRNLVGLIDLIEDAREESDRLMYHDQLMSALDECKQNFRI